MTRSTSDSNRSTRLSLRDVRAERVHRAMLEHADRIASVRDVQRLGALRDLTGETIAVAVADLVCQGRATGACGTGRVRAIERSAA